MADKPSKGLADIVAASTALSDIGGLTPADLFPPVFSVSRMAGWPGGRRT